MTAPYLPYSGQNYADWKRRFQETSAVGGLLRYATTEAGITPPPQGPAMLEPPPQPQAQAAPPMPPVMQPPEPTPEELHNHKKGLRGGLLHLFGADRQAPEVAALLSPEERARIRPGVASTLWNAVSRQAGPAQVQQERATNIVGLRDAKTARDRAERQEQLSRQIEQVSATMEPEAGVEYAARMKAIYGLPTSTAATQAAVGLRERVAPRVTWTTVPMMVDGKQSMVMRSNDGQLLDASTGTDLREQGARLEPMPQQAPPNQYLPTVTPEGTPTYTAVPGRGTGAPVETGLVRSVPGGQSPQEIKVINNERTLAFDDAQLSIQGLIGANGQMKEPPSSWDRFATQSDWLNWTASDDGQNYMGNTRKLIRSWVVLIEGKRMSDADARANEMMRSFRPGDKSLTIDGKQQTLESMAASIRALGRTGIALPETPGAPAAAPRGPSAGARTFTLRNGTVITLPPETP